MIVKQQHSELRENYDTLKQQQMSASKSFNNHSKEFWENVMFKCSSDPDEIKALINNKTLNMLDVNENEQTILLIASKWGQYEIVQLCLNLGSDLKHKDKSGKTALDHARDGAWYHVEQLLLFSEMNANIGNQIRDTAYTIKKQRGIIQNIMKQLSLYDKQTTEFFKDTMIDLITNIIKNRWSFSDDLLILCWEFEDHSKLWKTIANTCNHIIQNGNKRDWFWLKTFILPSTIWFKENKSQYLYYELLRLVDHEANNQLNILQTDLRLLSDKTQNEWQRLTRWDVEQQYAEVRQDVIPNGIVPKYSYQQLSEQGASSSSFNGHKFYDHNEYLPQLILLAQIVDDGFQKSVQKIFNIDKRTKIGRIMRHEEKTNDDSDGTVHFMRGPVKLMERARYKAQNDYFASKYPKSACVLDLNRCSLVFNDISTLLSALELFRKKIEYYQSGSIIGIVRSKNGFKQYLKETQYADIKLNVMIKGKRNNIIGEVQFLLRTMLEYKKKAHNLYSIQRQRDHIDTVSSILPILLDENTQLFVAGNMGDIKSLCGMMVILNKTEQDIMKVDEESKESILLNIVALGKYKAFKFLYSTINRELFIDRVFLCNRYDQNAVEEAVKAHHILLLKLIFSIREVKQRYANDDDLKYRLLWWLFGFSSDENIDFVMNELEINHDKMKMFMRYKYTNQYEQPILHIAVAANKESENVFKKILSILGDETFCDEVFRANYRDMNVLEMAIISGNMKIVKYILSFNGIKNKYLNDKDMFWRLIYWIIVKGTKDIIKFVLNELNVSEQQMVEFMEYEYTKESEPTAIVFYKHENMINGAITNNTLDIIKILISLIGEEMFCKLAFDAGVIDLNSIEVAVFKRKLKILKYLMKLKDIRNRYLNDKTQRFRLIVCAFGHGNESIIDCICNELNISNQEIIQFMHFEYDNNKNAKLLVETMQRNTVNILQKLVSIIGEKTFIEMVLIPNSGNLNAIEMSIRYNKLDIVKYILSFKEIKNKYLNDLDLLYRCVFWLFVDPDPSNQIIEYFITELNISNDQIVKFMNYNYTTKALDTFDETYWEYDTETILCRMGLMSTVDKLKKLISIIGEKAFIYHVFIADGRDAHPIEYCIRKNNLEMMKYIMSFDDIKTKCVNDEPLLFDILKTLFALKQGNQNEETVQYVIDVLDIDINVLMKMQTEKQTVNDT